MNATLARTFLFVLALANAPAQAHLNHIQFAAVDETGGKVRIRYRMSADMFMSNLDADIKIGRMNESIKQSPIDQIIRAYFKTHLLLEVDGVPREAEHADFEFDAKTSDWVADFYFDAPPLHSKSILFCDAFLENNPRTQTLARINWRGENTMYHLRAGNFRYALGSSIQIPAEAQHSSAPGRELFLDGLAQSFKAYDFLTAGALMLIVLGQIWRTMPRVVAPVLALAMGAALGVDQCGRAGLPCASGFALGWSAVVLTLYCAAYRFRRTE